MFLPLAERMVEKMVKEDKIEAEAEVSNLNLAFMFAGFDIATILLQYYKQLLYSI